MSTRLGEPVLTHVTIDRLGRRGEGIAHDGEERVAVPYALPSEQVSIDRDGDKGALVGIVRRSADRIDPICPYFGHCGGCAVQTLAPAPYAVWKRNLLRDALAWSNISAEVGPLVEAHGAGRRRATLHARIELDGRSAVGFMQARSHRIVPIATCPLFTPALQPCLAAARTLATVLASADKPLDLLCTATITGLDIDIRGHGAVTARERTSLIDIALAHDLARISLHGKIIAERRRPVLQVGGTRVDLPSGAFLQATAAGEDALADAVTSALRGASRVADLFSGIGTFALRLAETAQVLAVDNAQAAIAAMSSAARHSPSLRPITTEVRDLMRRPLSAAELSSFDAICLDPPRAGAEAQMRALAASSVPLVASVSCDIQSFTRDAAVLIAGGFQIFGPILVVDQFKYSPHVEIVTIFKRTRARSRRRLLG